MGEVNLDNICLLIEYINNCFCPVFNDWFTFDSAQFSSACLTSSLAEVNENFLNLKKLS